MGIKWAANARTTASAAAAAAMLAVGLAACGGINGPATSPTTTVTATAPASQAPAANSSATSSASHAADAAAGPSADTTGQLPDYQPSNMVSKTSTSAVLTSPDSVAKIGAFYADVLAKGGWHVISSSVGSFHASFTVSHDHQGASISVYPRWGGSGISISTYPR
jgi:predicted small lipoprotein YifL